jgi:RNA 2',3'-cyclic 3'-phosphodiesterase
MKTKRLFIGIPLPDVTKEALNIYTEPYKKLPGLKNSRWVTPVNLHITTLFLGDVLEEDIPKIQKQIQAVLKEIEPFDLIFERITFAPSERRPHMIWAEFQKNEKFVKLVELLQLSVVPLVSAASEKRHEPLAHVTLARLNNFYNKEKLHFPKLTLPFFPSLHVDACALMESELTNKGPIYSTLGTYPLCKSTLS